MLMRQNVSSDVSEDRPIQERSILMFSTAKFELLRYPISMLLFIVDWCSIYSCNTSFYVGLSFLITPSIVLLVFISRCTTRNTNVTPTAWEVDSHWKADSAITKPAIPTK